MKISSPSLNYFIILGAFLMYSSIYFFLFPSLNPVVVLTGCLVSTLIIVNIVIAIITATINFVSLSSGYSLLDIH